VRFIRGWVRATDWLLDPANRDAAIQVMVGEGYSASRAAEYYRRVVPKCAIDAAAIRKNIGLRIELGYYRPPHRPTEAFYDACYWAEATGLSAPPPVGLAGNAVT
jgi:hypothetical protein